MPSSKTNRGTYGLLGKAQHLSRLDHRSAYKGLAKTGEDWTQIVNMSERRRIQNRIAQRTYRQKVKDRMKGLEQKSTEPMTFIHLFPSSVGQTRTRSDRESESSHRRSPEPPRSKPQFQRDLSTSPAPSNQSWSPSPCLTCSELDRLSSSTPSFAPSPSSSDISMYNSSIAENAWPVFSLDIQPDLSSTTNADAIKPEFLVQDFDFFHAPMQSWEPTSNLHSAQSEQDCIQWLTGPSPYTPMPLRGTDYAWDDFTW